MRVDKSGGNRLDDFLGLRRRNRHISSYQIQMGVDRSRGNRLVIANTDELGGGGMRQPGQRLNHPIKYR
jgi:hypothetical protein